MFRWINRKIKELNKERKPYKVIAKDNTPDKNKWMVFNDSKYHYLDEAFSFVLDKSLDLGYLDKWKIVDSKTGESIVEVKFERFHRDDPTYEIWWKDKDALKESIASRK